MGQQFYVIRRNPAPGTPAFRAKQARDAHKAAKHGHAPAAEAGTETAEPEAPKPAPRQQPKKQTRSQRQRQTPKKRP